MQIHIRNLNILALDMFSFKREIAWNTELFMTESIPHGNWWTQSTEFCIGVGVGMGGILNQAGSLVTFPI